MKYLIAYNESSFEKDYLKKKKAQEILDQIKDNLKNGKYSEYSGGGYGMKIKDLNVLVYPEGSQGSNLGRKFGSVAQFSPDYKTLYSYGNESIMNPKTKKKTIVLKNDSDNLHELIHYLDSKEIGAKKMAKRGHFSNVVIANADIINKKLQEGKTAKQISRELKMDLDKVVNIIKTLKLKKGKEFFKTKEINTYYYNRPEEFNAHWFEFVMPIINRILDNEEELPSFHEFRDQVYDTEGVLRFLHYLNPKYNRKFDKRLAIYYDGLKDYLKGTPLNNAGKVYKSEGFLNKLKSLFFRKK